MNVTLTCTTYIKIVAEHVHGNGVFFQQDNAGYLCTFINWRFVISLITLCIVLPLVQQRFSGGFSNSKDSRMHNNILNVHKKIKIITYIPLHHIIQVIHDVSRKAKITDLYNVAVSHKNVPCSQISVNTLIINSIIN